MCALPQTLTPPFSDSGSSIKKKIGFTQSQSPPRQYPEAIQIKLYQAFIFSIPILFSVILFFCSTCSTSREELLVSHQLLLVFQGQSTILTSQHVCLTEHVCNNENLHIFPHFVVQPSDSDLKNELNDKLCTVLFDEDMEARDSLCCVCLGEFEVKEELVQVPSCKHIFHIDCLRRWLLKNSTCPLCRSPVVSGNNSGSHHHQPPTSPANLMLVNRDSNNHQGGGTSAIVTAIAA
ncbi:UNVERIFIED_CONTAM: putative E3 ubiquitin-protein ligase RHA4A [Sesamum calycinum]|uniref:RING-type E3 ubiquitin transferase n=1 Tax=Sesamum calycinum TaxID=2727403 RepID=A0AAW2QKN2_9LAMI